MRRPSTSMQLTSGSDTAHLMPSLESEEQRRMEWGAGGLVAGLLIGVVVGSKVTFHSPVRRRRH